MMRWRTGLSRLVAVLGSLAFALPFGSVAHGRADGRAAAMRDRAAQAYLALPLAFERNDGQAPAGVAYLARGIGHALSLGHDEAVLALARPAPAPWDAVRLQFVGADSRAEIRGDDELPGRIHYLRGSDRSQWRTDVPSFARVTYHALYPGIDLVFHGSGERLEYDFVIAPGATPDVIRLRVAGVESLAVDAAGDLHMRTAARELVQRAPQAHQDAGGRRIAVPTRFVLHGGELGFAVADWDRSRPLVIDPVLAYASHLGGAAEDGTSGAGLGDHLGVAVDASGSIVLVGETQSTDFPNANASQSAPGGGLDAFVTKFLPGGGPGLVYSTYLGGSDDDGALGVAIDAWGNAIVAGTTRSANFPTRAPLQPAIGGGGDAFVAKLSPLGALLFSTFLGGGADDVASAVAIDAQGSAHVAGNTRSADFPVRNALQPTPGGGDDAFVARLSPTGTLAYASYLGGSGDDEANAIAVATDGVVVTGATSSPDFPKLAPLQSTLRGDSDAFVTRFAPNEGSMIYSTLFGGGGADIGHGVVTLPSGVAVVIGSTTSADLSTLQPFQAASGGRADAFVAGFAPSGSALLFASYLGGVGDEEGDAVAIADGAIFLSGTTNSPNFPTVAPMQAALAGETDAWIARLAPGGTSLAFSTYLGGERGDAALGLAGSGTRVVVGGYTGSRLFPLANPLKSDLGVGTDAFVSVIDAPTTALTFSTFLGGSAEESSSVVGQRIAVDPTGHAYVTGPTASPGLATAGARQTALAGGSDVLVAKLDVDGSTLAYATYLGGSGDDAGLGIAVDAAGHAFVTGRTDSTDFPTVGAAQPVKSGGFDAFVAKLTPDGDDLMYSTFLGGNGGDLARGIAVDGTGAAVVSGATNSTDFPVRNAFQPAIGGGLDAFVTKLAPSGGAIQWSSYLGGSHDENPANTTWGLALDPGGNVIACGTTESPDFPLVSPVQSTIGLSRDAWVARIAADGSRILFSTYLGGDGGDTARDVATDALGRIYVVGATRSANFPVVNAIQPVHNDPLWYDAFVARIAPGSSGPVLDFSTFLGGSMLDGALGVAVDVAGNIHVTGQTTSPDFPIVGGDATVHGGDDAFLVVLPRTADRIGYSTRLGGADGDIAFGVAVDAAGSAYLTGVTQSDDFPTVAPVQAAPGGGPDAFVAKVALGPDAFACEVHTDQLVYSVGQPVRVNQLRVSNFGQLTLPGRLRLDLSIPGVGTFDLLHTSPMTFPDGFDASIGPFTLLTADASKPKGVWILGCSLEDPVTGTASARATAPFQLR
jgi:hypothetical protein